MIKFFINLFIVSVFVFAAQAQTDKITYRDIFPDTWVATDALGRAMPGMSETGLLKNDQRRVVGIFYITWHSDNMANISRVGDITKLLAKDPDARLDTNHPAWGGTGYEPWHWGEPEEGYFLSRDEYIIRRDISMLSDAGVDVLVMDVTNAIQYWSEWETLFAVMQEMAAEGNKVPKFCFWAFNMGVFSVVQNLYEKIYKQDKYRNLWFYWDDKPLLLCRFFYPQPEKDTPNYAPSANPNYDPDAALNPRNPHYGNPDYTSEIYTGYTAEVREFFTMRSMWDGYLCGSPRCVGTEDYWTFVYHFQDKAVSGLTPDELVSRHKGVKEQMAVSPAQHPASGVGKSWSRNAGEPELNQYDMPVEAYVPWMGDTVKYPEKYGIYFQERWDEALVANPQFVFLCDWNEWTHGKWTTDKVFLGRNSNFFFWDQYNAEFNRTLQPMKGGYSDNYYMQMAQNIRRYKGVSPVPDFHGFEKVVINGDFNDWQPVADVFRDTKGDIVHRDYDGYAGLRYTNTSGRNDILTVKTTVDEHNLYFYAATDTPLTPSTGKNWMLLLIDADNNHETGWNGYDFIVNKQVDTDRMTTVMKYTGNTKSPWKKVAQAPFRYVGNQLELAILRKTLGLTENQFTFDFKWSDNPKDLDDIISLCTSGDTAPNRRFNYRFIWKNNQNH
ncbi:MAG: hypothetical protein LBT83_00315 [Tannerella sp.]|jgi:hypothetical protein|nr:hypothetical protein [Tannerella sp.]